MKRGSVNFIRKAKNFRFASHGPLLTMCKGPKHFPKAWGISVQTEISRSSKALGDTISTSGMG